MLEPRLRPDERGTRTTPGSADLRRADFAGARERLARLPPTCARVARVRRQGGLPRRRSASGPSWACRRAASRHSALRPAVDLAGQRRGVVRGAPAVVPGAARVARLTSNRDLCRDAVALTARPRGCDDRHSGDRGGVDERADSVPRRCALGALGGSRRPRIRRTDDRVGRLYSPAPGAGDSDAEIADWYGDHGNRTKVWVAAILLMLAAMAFLWFLGSLRTLLRRVEGHPGRVSALAFGAGLVLTALVLAKNARSPLQPSRSPSAWTHPSSTRRRFGCSTRSSISWSTRSCSPGRR